jgi:hypothetical protein
MGRRTKRKPSTEKQRFRKGSQAGRRAAAAKAEIGVGQRRKPLFKARIRLVGVA